MSTVIQESMLDWYTAKAKGIAWDNCHKIYVLLDDQQMELMREYEYDPLISSDEMTPSEMSAQVKEWYEGSCGLRFISAIETMEPDPNEGFHHIVEQFADWEDEEEEEDED
jgi:hypothetical protein